MEYCPKYDAIKGLTFTTDVKHLKGGRLERPDHIPIDIFLNEIPFYRCDIDLLIVNYKLREWGYIDDGDGFWRQNVVTNITGAREFYCDQWSVFNITENTVWSLYFYTNMANNSLVIRG